MGWEQRQPSINVNGRSLPPVTPGEAMDESQGHSLHGRGASLVQRRPFYFLVSEAVRGVKCSRDSRAG